MLGPTITLLPLDRAAPGGGRACSPIFGLQWLRKAILRATGHKSLHDEASAYLREVAAAKAAFASSRGRVHDRHAFTLSFKGVLLEGLEVVFHRDHVRRQPAQRGRRGDRRGRGGAGGHGDAGSRCGHRWRGCRRTR